MISDVWIVESSPEFKGHSTARVAGSHDGSLDEMGEGEREGVSGLMVEGGVGDTECHVCAVRLENDFRD